MQEHVEIWAPSLGLGKTFGRGIAMPPQLGQKKWNDYLTLFMFVLLTVHQSIKVFPRLFYFSEYEILTARLSEHMKPVHDGICNRLSKLPKCVTIPPSLA